MVFVEKVVLFKLISPRPLSDRATIYTSLPKLIAEKKLNLWTISLSRQQIKLNRSKSRVYPLLPKQSKPFLISRSVIVIDAKRRPRGIQMITLDGLQGRLLAFQNWTRGSPQDWKHFYKFPPRTMETWKIILQAYHFTVNYGKVSFRRPWPLFR